MSSSSSESDSDDLEPIRRIKINIQPKDAIARRDGADVDAIKASVEAWRPLGPRPHHTLTRRQSSLSSVSSLSFGTGSNHGGSSSTTATSSTGANNYNFNCMQNSGNGEGGGCGATTAAIMTTTTRGNINNQNFLRSSPSCSSLVNDLYNRTSFTNFMSNTSRTSSPLTFINNYGDAVPIALAIQESIELTVKGQQGPNLSETKFETRALGNIKVAFPNTFARSCSNGYKPSSALKLRLHSTENILRYYASGLVKDNPTQPVDTSGKDIIESDDSSTVNGKESNDRYLDLFDMNESPTKAKGASKIIEFDMDALMNQVKQLYDQSPNARYYNVDVLRYQIAPIDQFEKCPIQACAYWRIEPRLVKLRIDFKHSNQSGLNLERLREIIFSVDLSNYVPPTLNLNTISPDAYSTIRSSRVDNNNLATFKNLSSGSSSGESLNWNFNGQQPQLVSNVQNSNHQYTKLVNTNDVPNLAPTFQTIQQNLMKQPPLLQLQQQSIQSNKQPSIQIRLPPPPSRHHSKSNNLATKVSNNLNSLSMSTASNDTLNKRQQYASFDQVTTSTAATSDLISTTFTPSQPVSHDSLASNNSTFIHTTNANNATNSSAYSPANVLPSNSHNIVKPTISTPYITYEPQANWNQHTKQLTWKFDNLLSYYKSDGYGSLLAKLDFRNCPEIQEQLLEQHQRTSPKPIDIKFMVVDSTLSKISMSIDSTGYRMSLLKKEVRSGRYTSEPYIF